MDAKNGVYRIGMPNLGVPTGMPKLFSDISSIKNAKDQEVK
jgi:hypothetical protein